MRLESPIVVLFTLNVALLIMGQSILTEASEIGPNPKTNKARTNEDLGRPQSTKVLQPLDVTEPGPEKYRFNDSYFYKYETSFSVNGGIFTSMPSNSFTTNASVLLTYLWWSPRFFHWESGAESLNNLGQVWTVARWYATSIERFRPFSSVGPGVKLIPANGLATFLQIANYFLRAAGGAEYGLGGRHSLRIEVFASLDAQGNSNFGLNVGYALGL